MFARPLQIGTRLTLWYVGIFGCVVAAYLVAACTIHYVQLKDQLYHDEVQDVETVEGLLYFTPSGKLSMHDSYFISPAHKLLIGRYLEVYDSRGQLLFRNSKLGNSTLGNQPVPTSVNEYERRQLHLADGTPVLTISHVRPLDGKLLLIRLGYSTQPIQIRTLELLGPLLLALPLALVAAGFAGYRVAGEVLNPLEKMAQMTEHITANRLNERIPIENPDDELGHMARVLNDLLERLEKSFDNLQHFVSDVSHELRTPLAAMRSVGEVGLQEMQDAARYRDIIGSMLEEVGRLTSMIDTLLTIAHAESGAIQLNCSSFAFMDLVRESISIIRVLAEDKNQSIVLTGAVSTLLLADRAFIRMAVVNLLDNAVKYSPTGSELHVNVQMASLDRDHQSHVELAIADEGPGISEGDRMRIFERFYRRADARIQESGGVGLGLSIAKWAVDAHGDEIQVGSAPGGGTIFTIRLPVIGVSAAESNDSTYAHELSGSHRIH